MLPRQLLGTLVQFVIAATRSPATPALLRSQSFEHDVDPALFVGARHPRREQDNRAVAIAVSRHRSSTAGTSPYLDRCRRSQRRRARLRPSTARLRRSSARLLCPGVRHRHGGTVSLGTVTTERPRVVSANRSRQPPTSRSPHARNLVRARQARSSAPSGAVVHTSSNPCPQQHPALSPPPAQRYPQVSPDIARVPLTSATATPNVKLLRPRVKRAVHKGKVGDPEGSGFRLSRPGYRSACLCITCGNHSATRRHRCACAAPERD